MKAKLITAATLTLAGCGLLAGRNTTAERRSPAGPEPPAAVNRIVPASASVETPLVAKLLPGGGESESPSKAAPPALRDGQLSPGGNFRYDADRNAYIPVDFGHTRYTENGHAPTVEHLIREHGHARSSAEKWTEAERQIAHANSHAASKVVRTVYPPVLNQTSGCPGGKCPSSPSSRGLFRRR